MIKHFYILLLILPLLSAETKSNSKNEPVTCFNLECVIQNQSTVTEIYIGDEDTLDLSKYSLPKLEILSIVSCQSLNPDLRHSVGPNLWSITFTACSLTEFPMISADISLTELILLHNRISKVPSRICQIKTLKVLNLGNNPIDTIPKCLSDLKNLQLLDLSFSDGRPTSVSKETIQHLKKELNNCKIYY